MKKLFLVLAVAVGSSVQAGPLQNLAGLPGKGFGMVEKGVSTLSGYVQSGVDTAEGILIKLPGGQHLVNLAVGAAEGAAVTGGAVIATNLTSAYSGNLKNQLVNAKLPTQVLQLGATLQPGVAPVAAMAALKVAQDYNADAKKVTADRASVWYWFGALVGAAAVQMMMPAA